MPDELALALFEASHAIAGMKRERVAIAAAAPSPRPNDKPKPVVVRKRVGELPKGLIARYQQGATFTALKRLYGINIPVMRRRLRAIGLY
jgi:hypothetical protein